MTSSTFNRLVLLGCLFASVMTVAGCGVRANDKTERTIIAHIHPQLKPVSEFQFVESSEKGRVEFEFKASNGAMFWGYFDGKMVHATRK